MKLSNTYFSGFPIGTNFSSRADSRYLARIVVLVSATELPFGKSSYSETSRSVSGTSIFSHAVSFTKPLTSVAAANGSL